MSVENLLLQRRSAIVKKWCDIVLRTYPQQSRSFLKRKDQFGNPVGHTISQAIEAVYDALLEHADDKKMSELLKDLIKIRAVQEFSPSKAVGFLFGLKKVIREELGSEMSQETLSEEWVALEAKIDALALLGFDIHAECREKIFDIRVNEIKTRSHRLLQMAGLLYEIPEYQGNHEEGQLNNNA